MGGNSANENSNGMQSKQKGDTLFSIQRFIINFIVRSFFFLFPIPLLTIDFGYKWNPIIPDYLPIGLSILLIGGLIGGCLDIILPKKYVLGGKIATKSFNIGTLSAFEGVEFNVKMKVGTSGKGISIKENRE